ncbi:hypothetical protein COB55_00910 [Candidatus Wolfebacteria bacterium]|nr:MAG: hypothetical protein COB55_00910 [Candidatus Wolfebacteria bacterium]
MIGIGHAIRHKQAHVRKISRSQRLECQLDLLIEITNAVHGDHFTPIGECPKCRHTPAPIVIMRGFLDNSYDTTTVCPNCGDRFQAYLIARGDFSSTRVQFWCPQQVLHWLGQEKRSDRTPDELMVENISVVRSALLHFGTLENAFRKIGNIYVHQIDDWKAKVQPFLGRASDRVIGECVGVTEHVIRTWRRKLRITGYSKQNEAIRIGG